MSRGVRRWRWALALAVLAGGLVYGGWRLLRTWRYRTALVEIQSQMQAGRHAAAARDLAALLAREPDSDELIYLLGACEKARGRIGAAEEAWARIHTGSPFAVSAALGRATILVDRGRFYDAERLLTETLSDPRVDGDPVRRFLAPLYWQEGRVGDALRLIEAGWEALDREGLADSDRAIELVRLHLAVSIGKSSAEAVADFLDRAERLAPDDDRIWLGRANLAIRRAEFDEAARRLDDCLRRRPEDVPAWRSRLDWALAAGRVAEAREALAHLPAEGSTPAQVQRLAAWFAARRGDATSERRALEKLIEADPGDGVALDRLAELATREGQSARAAELRKRKADLAPLRSRFEDLLLRSQPRRDAAEMARLAEQLGHFFEAKAFWILTTATESAGDERRAALERLGRRGAIIAEPGQTLADRLAPELGTTAAPPPADSPPRGDSSAAVRFRDDAEPAGLTHVFDNGASPSHHLPESLNGGVGLIDYDDGARLDIMTASGNLNDDRPDTRYAMPVPLLLGRPGARHRPRPAGPGA